MKKLTTILCIVLLVFIGCNTDKKKINSKVTHDTIINRVKHPVIYDTVVVVEDEYFISWRTKGRYGNFAFYSFGLPSYDTLQNFIYKKIIPCNFTTKSKKDEIIITGIYHFKDTTEYNLFYKNDTSNGKVCN